MKVRLKGAGVAALAVGIAATAAAASSEAASPHAQFGVDAKGTVVFYQRSATDGAANKLVPLFNKTHPGLTVKVTDTSPNDDTSTLATAIRAGNPPDVVGLNDIDVPEFTSENALMNLTKYIKQLPQFKAHTLSPGHLQLGVYKGQMYAVPYLADLSGLWYNKVLFKKAHIGGPPKTWAAMVKDADAIQNLKLKGVSGFSFAGDCQGCLGFAMLPNLWADHDYMITGQLPNQGIDIAQNAGLKTLLDDYHKIWANGDAPANDQTQNGTTWGDDFATGKIGMLPGGYSFYINFLKSGNAKEFGVVPLPGENGGPGATFDGGDDFVIPRGAKNASGAWEFVKWMLAAKQQAEFPKTGYTPIVTSVLTKKFAKQNPVDAVFLKALKTGYAPTTLIYDQGYNEPNSPWFKLFTSVVYHGAGSSAFSAAQSSFSQLLEQTNSGK